MVPFTTYIHFHQSSFCFNFAGPLAPLKSYKKILQCLVVRLQRFCLAECVASCTVALCPSSLEKANWKNLDTLLAEAIIAPLGEGWVLNSNKSTVVVML